MADKNDDMEDNEEIVDKDSKKKADDKKKVGKTHDPKKYVDLEPTMANNLVNMNEDKANTIVLTFGRFSPPTIGHEKLVNKVINTAIANKASSAIYLSHTQDKKKNPLAYDEKLDFMTSAFGKIVKKSKARNILDVLKEVATKYDSVIIVVGEDRVDEFKELTNRYNGQEYKFDSIDVVSAGERDPDAEGVVGVSGTKMRALANDNNIESFTNGLPKKLRSRAKEVFDAVRRGMKLMEEVEELDEKVHALDFSQRRKRAMTMKRYAGKMERARERARLRRSNPEKLMRKARKRAISILKRRLAGKRDYSTLSPSEKMMVDKMASRISDAAIQRMAQKQLGAVRKIETERISKHNVAAAAPAGVNIKHPDSDTTHRNEAFENFVENYLSDVASSGEQRSSLHKGKSFHSMFRKTGGVKTDGRFRSFRKANESLDEQFSELFNFQEIVESLEYIDKIAKREASHKEISAALKDFTSKMGKKADSSHVDLAKEVLAKHKIDFTPRQLVALHYRIKNAKSYEKAYNNVDAWESVQYEQTEKPSDREWGTASLTKTYRDDTPGQEDMDINEKFKNFVGEESKGLWHNIHARRKKGLRPKRPGEKGYPKTLDIE